MASIALLVIEALLSAGSPCTSLVRRLERVILVCFAVEIVLRVGSYRPPSLQVFHPPPIGRLRAHLLARPVYVFRPIILDDIVAVLALFPELRGLRALRLLRLLRTSRVFRYRNPFAIVVQTLEENELLFSFAFSVLGATTMSQVLISGAHNVYVGHIPDAPKNPVSFGDLLVKMQLSK